ncbi:MAG TPA: YidC/Oxa1 family membrane protein insertase, partial [Armatimonadota bacterium]|nr:YidC/Oxa1 family membrane protein insertase [Armatimonadota bacterium]
LAEEQMKLMKEHKVSPLGGCLPMLIQLPIFIVVYRAVQVYAAGFADSHFLWIGNLSRPDMILLVLYAFSMIITQKLTATPATDAQQKMMQQQMTYFMPIFLFFILQSIASAFVLYWFFLNVFSAIHQYYLMEKFKQEDIALGRVTPDSTPASAKKKKGK